MPKTFYTNESDIPDNLKGAYEAKNGRWELTKLDDDHPVVKTKGELETTQGTLKTELSDTKQKLTIAETKTLPDGMVAVKPEIKELGETANNLGLKKTDVSALKTRAETAEAKLTEETESKVVAKAAAAAGKNSDAFAEHATAKGLKFKETTVKDGKGNDVTSIVVVTKGADDKEVETPLKDYVDKNAAHVAAAEKHKPRFGFPREKGEKVEGNKFDAIREKVKQETGTVQNGNLSFAERFHGAKVAGS